MPTWADQRGSRIERHGDGVLVVHLLGDFAEESGANMAELVAQAIAARPAAVVLDLDQVDFLGSSALSILVRARGQADAAGIAMGLVAVRRVTLLPLELTGLTRVFPVYPSVREAVAGVRGQDTDALSA
jgi:anti-anti-sigma factor